MGSLFKKPGLKTTSSLSQEQQDLLPALRDYISPFLNGDSPELGVLTRRLMQSTSGESRAMSERIFNEALMGPALRSYDTQIAPRINSEFARYGGSLSTRRTSALAQTLGDITTNATGQLAQMLPTIQSFPLQQTLGQIQGLTGIQSARFMPYEQALRFALTPTTSTQQSPGGPGWGLLNSALGAGGFILGGGLGGK